jgi:hypothetical protein
MIVISNTTVVFDLSLKQIYPFKFLNLFYNFEIDVRNFPKIPH